jgi:hypothetical protein
MDSLTRKETPDRGKINMHSAQEVKCWTHELGITREQLQKLRQGRQCGRKSQEGVEREKSAGGA